MLHGEESRLYEKYMLEKVEKKKCQFGPLSEVKVVAHSKPMELTDEKNGGAKYDIYFHNKIDTREQGDACISIRLSKAYYYTKKLICRINWMIMQKERRRKQKCWTGQDRIYDV